jgi:hypothetical protein
VWVYVPEPPPEQADARLSRAATTLGGYLDGGNTGLRILTVPLSAGFKRIEAEVEAAVAELSGSSWAYGNVYDRQKRRPAVRLVGRASVNPRALGIACCWCGGR